MQESTKSVRSARSRYESSSKEARKVKEVKMKDRIKQILMSVKQEKQHIENRLHENDIKIQKYTQEYQMLKYQYDFDHLNNQERIILQQLSDGLIQMGINPVDIIGKNGQYKSNKPVEFKQLTKEEVIEVQNALIGKLKAHLQNL